MGLHAKEFAGKTKAYPIADTWDSILRNSLLLDADTLVNFAELVLS